MNGQPSVRANRMAERAPAMLLYGPPGAHQRASNALSVVLLELPSSRCVGSQAQSTATAKSRPAWLRAVPVAMWEGNLGS